MQALIAILVAGMAIAGLIYLVCLFKLQGIVRAEMPEWLTYKGQPSIFYSDMPQATDPNVGLKVVAVAFSNKVNQLTAPEATKYAMAIRIALPLALLAFSGIIICIFLQGKA